MRPPSLIWTALPVAGAVLVCAPPSARSRASAAAEANVPSVLVQTETPRRGTLPELVVAYGTAGAALDGGMTLSLPRDGRVLSISVTPGEQVRMGEHLVEFATSAGAASAYQQAGTALVLARTQRSHAAQLLAQQLATRDQLAQADKAVSDAREVLDTLAGQGADRPRSALEAPFDGIVDTITVAQGDRVAAGAPLLTLTRLDGLVVTVGLQPDQRGRVRRGQPAELQRLGGGATVQGSVLRVDGTLNPRTRLVDCDISVPVGSVLSGEAFRAAVTVGLLAGWLVPRDTVLGEAAPAGEAQDVVSPGPQATPRPVTTHVYQVNGERAASVPVAVIGSLGETDVVTGDLQPQRGLVVSGSAQLSDGALVRTTP